MPSRFFAGRVLPSVMLLWIGVTCVACSPKPESPEAKVRAVFAGAEAAAEARDASTFKSYIAENYADSEGRDRRALEGIARFYFLRNQSIHLYTRIDQLTFPAPDQAQAILYVAMAGDSIASAADVARVRAALHRFEVSLTRVEQGDWKIAAAEWRRAELTDF